MLNFEPYPPPQLYRIIQRIVGHAEFGKFITFRRERIIAVWRVDTSTGCAV
jgi:hypothetical protein